MSAGVGSIDHTAPVGSGALAVGRWLPALALLTALGVVVAGRSLATRAGLDALGIGAVFGFALAGLAAVRFRALPAPSRPMRRDTLELVAAGKAVAVGVAVGFVLVAVVIVGASIAGTQLVPGLGRPAAPFLPWALITILVASAEEALLRGRIFDAVRRAGGVAPAILVTTVAFALMHVPLYGWHVVPLDLAVGLGFAGLRLATRGIAAPAAAHAVADLATWWL